MIKTKSKPRNYRHGYSRTGNVRRIYRIWVAMKGRCLNENDAHYNYYGGRGISVCERWLIFDNFLEDMKNGYSDQLTLDRMNNDGNYEPSNCRWATHKEQQMNRRPTHSYRGRVIRHICKVINCGIASRSLDLCENHYRKFRRGTL